MKSTTYIRYIGRRLATPGLILGLILVLAGCNWAAQTGVYDATITIQTPETSQLYPSDGARRSQSAGTPLRPALIAPAATATSSIAASVTAAEVITSTEQVEAYGYDWFEIIVIREDLLVRLIEAEQADLTEEELDELAEDLLGLEEQFSESALESFFEALFYGEPATLRANFGGQGGGLFIQANQDYQAGDSVPFTFRDLEGDARYVILSNFERDTETGYYEIFGIDRVPIQPSAVTDLTLQLDRTCADFEGQLVEWYGAGLDWCYDGIDEGGDTDPDPLEGSITLTGLDEIPDLFIDTIYTDIVEMELAMTNLDINNSDDSLIPERTVLVYETSEGRFGKMLIVGNNAGNGIVLEHETYDAEGEPFNTTEEPVEVGGTFRFSLDTGEVQAGGDDFWLQNLTATERLFSPQNGARFYAIGIDQQPQ